MNRKDSPKGHEDLRKRAEGSLQSVPDRPDGICFEEANRLIHELQVHQVELEMQNEELRRVQDELEISRSRYADLYDFAPVGYLSMNKAGQIVDLNLTAARLLGVERGRLLNEHFQYFVFTPDKKEFFRHLEALFETRERQLSEIRLSPKNSEQLYARLESIYMEERDGDRICRTNMSDVTRNRLAEQVLQNAHDELERCVRERTTDLGAAIVSLEQTNLELQDFAYVATHDLQEPLRKIQTFCDMAIKRCGPGLDSACQGYLERVINSASRMRGFLSDLLLYGKSSEAPKQVKRIDLAKIAREACELFGATLKDAGGQIEVEQMPSIEADEGQMLRLFQALIGNCVKFRSDRPLRINVYAKQDAQGICEISVKDNGIGFDPQFAELIFKPFRKLHGRDKYDGTGIGLTLCRKVVERLGGSIKAESEPSNGSTFIIRLPVKQIDPKTASGDGGRS